MSSLKLSRNAARARRVMLLASAVSVAAGAAWAQEARTLGPVQVEGQTEGEYRTPVASSPRQTAPLVDQPQTVSVIPQQVIREQGARNLTEVLRNTPGISFNAGENGFSTSTNNFQLRGFDASGNVFVDGARDSGSFARDVFNIEAVEVVKGAAADNGRGGAGGYVNMVTKAPSLEDFVNVDASLGFTEYGERAQKRAAVDINQVIDSGVALRLNAVVEDSGIAGRDLAKNGVWGVAPSIAFGLLGDFRLTLAYEHVERNDRPDWGLPGAFIEGTVNYDPATNAADRDLFYGLRSDYDDVKSDAASMRLEYDLSPNATISNVTRWSDVSRESQYTVPTGFNAGPGTVNTQIHRYDRTNESITNTTNLSTRFATGAINHNLSLGLELTREESDANRFGSVPGQPTINPTNPGATPMLTPDPDRFAHVSPVVTETASIKVETIAVYAYDTIQITDQLQLTGGVRYEDYSVDLVSRDAAGLPAGIGDFSGSDESFTGRIGAVYKPTENSSLYASFGISSQSPGSYLSNPDISRAGNNAFPGYVAGAKAVESYNYEIGGKIDLFEERLTATLALFQTEKRNVPFTGRTGTTGPTFLFGYGKQVVQGVELNVAGQVTDAWRVFGGIAIMDSERKHDPALDLLRRNASPNDYRLGGVSTNPFFTDTTNGDELAFTPNVTGNLWTTYDIRPDITVGGGVRYVGKSWLGRPDDAERVIPNGIYGELPSYFLVDLMASYDVNENVTLRANVDNVFDEFYAVSTNWNGVRATIGAPRTYRISASIGF